MARKAKSFTAGLKGRAPLGIPKDALGVPREPLGIPKDALGVPRAPLGRVEARAAVVAELVGRGKGGGLGPTKKKKGGRA